MIAAMNKSAAIETMSFEDALGELEAIVKNIESGQAKLEDSITAYERGISLKTHCENKLKEAQAKIEKITVSADGVVATEPLDQE